MWTLRLLVGVLCLAAVPMVSDSQYYGSYYCRPGRDVVVQLFEWKWTDVAKECRWLAQHDFCAVQVCNNSTYTCWDRRPFGHNRHGSKIGGCPPFLRVELSHHLTQCRLGPGLPPYQWHLDTSSRLAKTPTSTSQTGQTTVQQYRANRFTNAGPINAF